MSTQGVSKDTDDTNKDHSAKGITECTHNIVNPDDKHSSPTELDTDGQTKLSCLCVNEEEKNSGENSVGDAVRIGQLKVIPQDSTSDQPGHAKVSSTDVIVESPLTSNDIDIKSVLKNIEILIDDGPSKEYLLDNEAFKKDSITNLTTEKPTLDESDSPNETMELRWDDDDDDDEDKDKEKQTVTEIASTPDEQKEDKECESDKLTINYTGQLLNLNPNLTETQEIYQNYNQSTAYLISEIVPVKTTVTAESTSKMDIEELTKTMGIDEKTDQNTGSEISEVKTVETTVAVPISKTNVGQYPEQETAVKSSINEAIKPIPPMEKGIKYSNVEQKQIALTQNIQSATVIDTRKIAVKSDDSKMETELDVEESTKTMGIDIGINQSTDNIRLKDKTVKTTVTESTSRMDVDESIKQKTAVKSNTDLIIKPLPPTERDNLDFHIEQKQIESTETIKNATVINTENITEKSDDSKMEIESVVDVSTKSMVIDKKIDQSTDKSSTDKQQELMEFTEIIQSATNINSKSISKKCGDSKNNTELDCKQTSDSKKMNEDKVLDDTKVDQKKLRMVDEKYNQDLMIAPAQGQFIKQTKADNVETLNDSTQNNDSHSNQDISVKDSGKDIQGSDNEANNSDMSLNDSVKINKDHGLKRPDMMLEIPTQELIDIDDLDDTAVDSPNASISSNYEDKFEEVSEAFDNSTPDENKTPRIRVISLKQLQGITSNDDQALNLFGQGSTAQTIEIDTKKTDPEGSELEKQVDNATDGNQTADGKTAEDTTIETSIPIQNSLIEMEVQPSTSKEMVSDAVTEMPEMTDSLGLLAESSRVMVDEEEPEEDDDGDGDDDDDFDQDDESSNQMTADHSEDSNQHNSGSETTKEANSKNTSPQEEKDSFQFNVATVVGASEMEAEIGGEKAMQVDEIESAENKLTSEVNIECDADTTENKDDAIVTDTIVKEDVSPEQSDKEKELPNETSDIETVKLSDTSDNEEEEKTETKISGSILRQILHEKDDETPDVDMSAIGAKSVSRASMDVVDLEGSSSEDDIQEVKSPDGKSIKEVLDQNKTINFPSSIEVKPGKMTRLNTSEITIKTANKDCTPLIIPETVMPTSSDKALPVEQAKMGLEIFSLESSDEEDGAKSDTIQRDKTNESVPKPASPVATRSNKCINAACTSGAGVEYARADARTVARYSCSSRGKKSVICSRCAEEFQLQTQSLVEGIRSFRPLLTLTGARPPQELVEISDSESEDEAESPPEVKDTIGEADARVVENSLAEIINDTWKKFKMDARLKDTEELLKAEMERMEQESQEIDRMLGECQVATDKLRTELYSSFEQEQYTLPALTIMDTPNVSMSYIDDAEERKIQNEALQQNRRVKRRNTDPKDPNAKRPALPAGQTGLDTDKGDDDADKDISVVKLSKEEAPAELPPPGECPRPPVRVNTVVYAMKSSYSSWEKATVLEANKPSQPHLLTSYRVKFEQKVSRNVARSLTGKYLAYAEPAPVRLTIGTRVIALCKNRSRSGRDIFFSGVVAEVPNPVNNYRYLVFFDDGYAQYVPHTQIRVVCVASSAVWDEVHPIIRDFIREYLRAYPERPMVRLHAGQRLKVEWNGKWWSSRVLQTDASLAHVYFEEDNRSEWIYRGSTRLAPLYLELHSAEKQRPRFPRNRAQQRSNMPYVEYTRSDELAKSTPQQIEETRRQQRAVAKKSTALPAPPVPIAPETPACRVVFYTPKNAVRPAKLVPHSCGPRCRRADVLSLDQLRTYNPLAKPLLSGWERQTCRHKGHREVMYRAPCGRRLRSMRELHRYLRATRSELPVDLFDFHPNTHCLSEYVLASCNTGKKDLSFGKENVPVPCVNCYDDSLPEFCTYSTERTPTAGVPLNLDPDFLCGCDCTDDCEDKSKCACWKMTLEGARTIGLTSTNVGYEYKRLPEPLPSGIYECNSRCKCKNTCLNRVAQHPLQLKLQVFKTPNRGWGIRSLNDVPKGAFLCVYAGNLLTDATANLDGLNEGDEYLAELDYIEVVEQMKEGYEEDIPEADKALNQKDGAQSNDEDEEGYTDSASDGDEEKDQGDDDFRPTIGVTVTVPAEGSKRLRRSGRKGKEDKEAKTQTAAENVKEDKEKEEKTGEDCITISDDEEVREPSAFTAAAGPEGAGPRHLSVRAFYGRDEACYIMDAKVQGNIGRYLNHSCCPNVFVQNVFVDTHDPRFPWVAFFALAPIKAGTELTWNYNYDVGSVPGKVLHCFCGAPNCRGRLL